MASERTAGERRGLRPGARIAGTLVVPPSKSLAQRALVAAALARGRTTLVGLGAEQDFCGDLRAALGLVRGLGAEVEVARETTIVPPARCAPPGELAAGESGTLARLATAVLALRPGPTVRLGGSGTLLSRESAALFACLREAGARLAGSTWPVAITPAAAPAATLELAAPSSSQEVSALLLALAARAEPAVLDVRGAIPSRPYLALTRGLLARFGAEIEEQPQREGTRFLVHGPLVAPAAPLVLEPDASAAAVGLAAACITGGELCVPGLTPEALQGDVRIVEHLQRFGCTARLDARGLHASGRPMRGATLDLSGEPDLAPVLAAVGAALALRSSAAEARTRLLGLATLQHKESRRLDVLAGALRRLGLVVETTRDSLSLAPPARASGGRIVLDPHGDHRMAFAFALLGLARDGVDVLEPACVEKSWPSFWRDLARVGATLA